MTTAKLHGARKPTKHGERHARDDRLALAAMGLEAEFAVVLDGHQVRPEDLFGSPTRIVRVPMMHRVGRSYHLPTGGAVYFDTGVIEIATPVIEIERGCAARAGRVLWENIRFLRGELDAWEARAAREAREAGEANEAAERDARAVHLAGFSTHYNVSFDGRADDAGVNTRTRSVEQLAVLLVHILPIPVMLLAANRRSTGIGVRPRAHRVEVTADFTPDAALMIAAATLIVGIVREVMTWPTFTLDELRAHGLPTLRDFTPEPHSSRKGWVARCSSFAENPFAADVNAPIWPVRHPASSEARSPRSLRDIAAELTEAFWPAIARLGDPRSLRLIRSVMSGRRPSLLELDDRPPSYESVGKLCTWPALFPERALTRSRYERVFMRAIAGRKLQLDGDWYTPAGMRGWSHVVYRRDRDRTRHVMSLDFLLRHL